MRITVPKELSVPFLVSVLSFLCLAEPVRAQVLHTNDRWDECSIVIDPSLTQEAWHQFVREVGLVTFFRPLTTAKPLGPRHFDVSVLSWSTRIDDADAAWNDTFSHPNAHHPLFEGDALMFPGLSVRAGVTQRVDLGAYLTKNFNANYGFVGGLAQYNLLHDTARGLAAAGRLSAVFLYGPEDMNASTYGLELLASKDIWRVSPYAAVSGYLSRGHETTSKVDLDDENILGVQATIGAAASLSVLRLGAEFNLAKVTGYAFRIGLGH